MSKKHKGERWPSRRRRSRPRQQVDIRSQWFWWERHRLPGVSGRWSKWKCLGTCCREFAHWWCNLSNHADQMIDVDMDGCEGIALRFGERP